MPARPTHLALCSLLLALGACSTAELRPRARTVAGPDPLQAFVDAPFDHWSLLVPGAESRSFSSFDRGGGNADGFKGSYSALYELDDGQQVIFDAFGPGVLRTLWFTGPEEGGKDLDLGIVRFYFDHERQPRLVLRSQELLCGRSGAFRWPLVTHNGQSTGGFASWVPLPFASRLRITTSKRPGFYAAYYDRLPAGTPLTSFAPGRPDAALEHVRKRLTRRRVEKRWQVIPLVHRHQGAGTITGLRFTPDQRPTAARLLSARLRIFWDGEQRPSVDVPVGPFFGSALGDPRLDALAFSMWPGGPYENRFPMPFWRGFRLELKGMAGKLELMLGPAKTPRKRHGTFHARWHRQSQPRAGEDFLWLDTGGSGKLVGTVLAVRPHRHVKKWWEGDLRSYADGRRTPGIHGTGLEDDHLGGWSNTFFSRPFSLPLHGEPAVEMLDDRELQHNARVSVYRLWPGIPFLGHLRHGLEHGSENGVTADYAGAVFYYRSRNSRLEQSDLLRLDDAVSRREHDLTVIGSLERRVLRSAFEGEGYLEPLEQAVFAHRGAARFLLRLPRDNQGCWLRRLYDQHRGRQHARVLIDEHVVDDWYEAQENRLLRWAERDVFLPPAITAGKGRIAIRLVPQGGTSWTAAEYRLLCLRPTPAL